MDLLIQLDPIVIARAAISVVGENPPNECGRNPYREKSIQYCAHPKHYTGRNSVVQQRVSSPNDLLRE
jgi:hypothetical protein